MPRPRWTLVPTLAVLLAAAALAEQAPPQEERAAKLIAVLAPESGATLEQKCEACRHLAGLGSAEATPVLAALLDDPKLSHRARYALEPSPDPAAGKALRDALAALEGELLVGVIHSVGMRRDAKAVGALAGLLEAADTTVAAAAAQALGRIAAPEAAEALAGFRKTAPEARRPAAADASLRAARGLLRRGQRERAAAIYRKLHAK
ncbi:MAG: hypothetical protein ACODAJ_16115, partial [Planctomycetota bacterium]